MADRRRRHRVGEHARQPPRQALAEELRGGQGQVLALARGGQAADERQPERELLDVGGRAGDVETAERPADGVDERQQGRQSERGHQRHLLDASRDECSSFTLLRARRRLRYSSRYFIASSKASAGTTRPRTFG